MIYKFPIAMLGEGGGLRMINESLYTRLNWQLRASCRGPQSKYFYPPVQGEKRVERLRRENFAKSICKSCPVKEECLTYAIENHEIHGIWGGLTEFERRKFYGKNLLES